jgi:flagellin
MANSINTNISAYFAQANITAAANASSSSVARLSSGNRIVQASDDVAALSIGTSLKTSVATLRTALTNSAQASSLLQVADGALAQVTEILQRQKAIAVQAGSGSLDAAARGFLNQEFQQLSAEIDRLTGSTNFNGVKLLNGTLSDTVKAVTNTNKATSGTLVFNFDDAANALPAVAQTFIINGVTLALAISTTTAAANNVVVGDTIVSREAAVAAIARYINNVQNDSSANAPTAANKALLAGLKATANGTQLTIESRAGGTLGQNAYAVRGTTGTFVNTVTGNGDQQIYSYGATAVTSLDVNATASSVNDFATGAITLGGVTLYTVVASDSLRKIVAGVNANAGTTGITAYITGTSGAYVVNFRTSANATGTLSASGDLAAVASGTTTLNVVLSGASQTGLQQGGVIGYGSTGDASSLITSQSQKANISRIAFSEPATLASLASQSVTIAGRAFTFSTNVRSATAQSEVGIGTTLQETLDNLVEKLNTYRGNTAENYTFDQFEAVREGTDVVIRTRQATNNATVIAAATGITIAVSGSNITTPTNVSATALVAQTNTGIDAGSVTNTAFAGVIQGFTASYAGASNRANLSVIVGGITYTALSVNTTPTADGDILFSSDTGGSFKVRLRGGTGLTVDNTADAVAYAKALDAAFAGVTFYQKRDVSSYNATGSLLGTSVRYQGADFSKLNVDSISVQAPTGSSTSGTISFTINGEVYAASSFGTQIGANSVTRFISSSDPNKYLEFRNAGNVLSLANADSAKTLQTALKTAFGVGTGQASLSFQVGVTASDSLSVSIGNATTSSLFDGVTLNVLDQLSASDASVALDTALATLTSLRANVGALQSRFNFAAANIQTSVQNQDAARAGLLDTDIAFESTNFATNQVKLQAGISVLAQANQQVQNLLKLIQ